MMDGLHESMTSDMMVNHYCHPRGRPRLINALKKHFSPRFENIVKEGRELKDTEIMAAAGANGGESWVYYYRDAEAAESGMEMPRGGLSWILREGKI